MGSHQSFESLLQAKIQILSSEDISIQSLPKEEQEKVWESLLSISPQQFASNSKVQIMQVVQQLLDGIERGNAKTKNFNSLILYTSHLLNHANEKDRISKASTAVFLLRLISQHFIQNLSSQELEAQLIIFPDFAPRHHFYQPNGPETKHLVWCLLQAMTNFLITHPINDECSILHEEIIKLFVILFSTEMLQPVGESTNLFLDLMLEPVDGYSINAGLVEYLLRNYLLQEEISSSSSSWFWSAVTGRKGKANEFKAALMQSTDRTFINENDNTQVSFQVSYKQLFDTITTRMDEDVTYILLYELLHGHQNFLSYALSRTDIDELIIPMLKVLYTPNQHRPERIYTILISLLILSEDQYFCKHTQNVILPTVYWFKEQYILDISLAGLITVILMRTMQLNLNKLEDTYLQTNCLATISNISMYSENMHPYVANRLLKLLDIVNKKWIKYRKTILFAEQGLEFNESTPSTPNPSMPSTPLKPLLATSSTNNVGTNYGTSTATVSNEPTTTTTTSTTTNSTGNGVSNGTSTTATTTTTTSTSPTTTSPSVANQPQKNNQEISSNKKTASNTVARDIGQLERDLLIFESFLSLILEVINSILTYKIQYNPSFVYALVYEKFLFSNFEENTRFDVVIGNINTTIDYFNRALLQVSTDKSKPELNANTVLEVIQDASKKWKSNALSQVQGLHFKYEEEDAEQFFAPYIWSNIYFNSYFDRVWDPTKLRLFGELLQGHGQPQGGVQNADSVAIDLSSNPKPQIQPQQQQPPQPLAQPNTTQIEKEKVDHVAISF